MSEADTVLVVDDDASVLSLYERYLSAEYEVLTAATGTAAIEALGPAIDVALLDRRMPDVPGDEVLAEIRDRDLECRVAMVTAVDPDLDVIDMAFDDYLVKPVREQEVRETVAHLLTRLEYSDLLTEYYRVASKIAALEAAKHREELAASEEFAELEQRADALRGEVARTLEEMDDYATAFTEIAGPAESS